VSVIGVSGKAWIDATHLIDWDPIDMLDHEIATVRPLISDPSAAGATLCC
jgi:hypothetical protein